MGTTLSVLRILKTQPIWEPCSGRDRDLGGGDGGGPWIEEGHLPHCQPGGRDPLLPVGAEELQHGMARIPQDFWACVRFFLFSVLACWLFERTNLADKLTVGVIV